MTLSHTHAHALEFVYTHTSATCIAHVNMITEFKQHNHATHGKPHRRAHHVRGCGVHLHTRSHTRYSPTQSQKRRARSFPINVCACCVMRLQECMDENANTRGAYRVRTSPCAERHKVHRAQIITHTRTYYVCQAPATSDDRSTWKINAKLTHSTHART